MHDHWMRKFVHQGWYQDLFYSCFLFLTENSEALSVPPELAQYNLRQQLLHFDNRGTDVKRTQLLNELLYLSIDDRFGLMRFAFAFLDVRLHYRVEIIHIEQESVFQTRKCRIDVS